MHLDRVSCDRAILMQAGEELQQKITAVPLVLTILATAVCRVVLSQTVFQILNVCMFA